MIKQFEDTMGQIRQTYHDFMRYRDQYEHQLEEMLEKRGKMIDRLLEIGNEQFNAHKTLYDIVKECDHCLPKYRKHKPKP